jgi:hypothetical protein
MEIKRIFGIALALMFGAVIITGIFTLNEQGLQIFKERTTDQLENTNTPTVTIGAPPNDSPEEAKKQLEGLIVWNAMAASDCRILAGAHAMESIKWGEEAVDEVEGISNDDLGKNVLEIDDAETWLNGKQIDGSDNIPEVNKNNKNALYTFSGFGNLIKGGYTRECLGSKSIKQEIENTIQEQIEETGSNLLGDIAGGLLTIGKGIALGAACLSSGPLCGAVAVGITAETVISNSLAGRNSAGVVGEAMGKTLIPGATRNLANDVGFDMEGRYGRVNIEMNRTVYIGTNYPDPIIGFNFKADDGEGNEPDWKENSPGFWRGQRFMYAVPPGLAPQESDGSDCCALEPPEDGAGAWSGPFDGTNQHDGFGDGRKNIRAFYAWRVRMIREEKINDNDFKWYNIPLAVDEDELNEINQEDLNYDGDKGVDLIRDLLKETNWVLCRGAEGYIQSNAYKMFNDGETQAEDPEKEGNVYPIVKLTKGATDCLDQSGKRSIEEIDGISNSASLVDGFESLWNQDFGGDMPEYIACEKKDDLGRGVQIFSKEKADGGRFTTEILCTGSYRRLEIDGTDNKYEEDEASPYTDRVQVYYPDEPRLDGCSEAHYDVTEKNNNPSGQTAWSYNRPDPRKQVTIKDLKITPQSSASDSYVYETNITVSENGDEEKLRVIVGKSSDTGNYKFAMFREGEIENTGSIDPDGAQHRTDLRLQENEIGVEDRIKYGNAGGSDGLGLGGQIDESEFGNQIESIRIGNMTQNRIEELNSEIDSVEFGENQGFELDEVAIRGIPRLCNKKLS